jgi:probable addiction module antidote protein
MSTTARDVSYEAELLKSLKAPAEAAAYLEAYLEDEDPAVFLLALRQVAKAKGMTAVARESGLQRESIYKSLSATGNPELRTVKGLLHALGLRLSVVPERV